MTYKRSARLRSNSFPISCLLSLVFLTPSNQILFALVWTDFYTSLPLAYQSDTSWYVSSRHSSLAAKIKLTSNFLLYSIKSQGNDVELVKFNKWKNPFEKKNLSQTVKKVHLAEEELFRRQAAISHKIQFTLLPQHWIKWFFNWEFCKFVPNLILPFLRAFLRFYSFVKGSSK